MERPCIISTSPLQNNPNTGLGTAANVDQMMSKGEECTKVDGELGSIKTTNLNVADIVEHKKKKSRRKLVETASDEIVSCKLATSDGKTVSKGEEHAKVDGVLGSVKTINLNVADIVEHKKKKSRRKLAETASGETNLGKLATSDAKMESKGEERTKVDGELGSIKTTNLNVVDIVEHKKKKSRRKLAETASGELGKLATSDAKMVSKGEEHTKVGCELGSSKTINLNVADIVEHKKKKSRRKLAETASDEAISGKLATSDGKIASKGKERTKDDGANLHVADIVEHKKKKSRRKLAETDSDEAISGKLAASYAKTVSKGKERMKDDSEFGSIKTTNLNVAAIVEHKKKKSRRKLSETASDETVSGKPTTSDAKRLSKEVECTKVDGELGSSLNVADIVEHKKKRSEIKLVETDSDGTISGKLATSDAKMTSKGKERKKVDGELGSIKTTNLNVDIVEHKKERSRKENTRQRSKNKNPTSGDVLSTCESMQDMVIAKEGLSTNKVLDSRSFEMVSGKTETPDAKMVPKGEELTKSINGKVGSGATTVLNVNGTVKEKQKLKLKNKRPTIGEIMDPKCLKDKENADGETMSVAIVTDDAASKNKRGKKGVGMKKKPDLGDILSAGESTHERMVMKKDMDTNNLLEAKITNLKEDCPKIVNGEKCMLTMKKGLDINGVLDAGSPDSKREDYPKTANAKMGSVIIVTDDAAPKKRKKQHKKPGSDDMLSNGASMRDSVITRKDLDTKGGDCSKIVNGEECMVIAKENSDTNNFLEAKTDSKVEDYPKAANCDTSSVTIVTDDTSSKKRKRKRDRKYKNKKPTSGDMLSIDTMSTEKDSDTNNVFDAKSTSSNREAYPKIINGEKCPQTIALDADSKKNRVMSDACENTEAMPVNEIPHATTSRKKLLIFDVNGLIADVLYNKPKSFKADINIQRRAIFKRPFLDDFLRFCFERFDVAIWSSRTGRVLNPVINYLFGDLKNKLVFVWHASNCTNTKARTLENSHKFIVFKDLRKIWQKNDPGGSWVKGTYNESNTLLVDDSPYKALLNPKHTGIFPVTYSYMYRNDNSLGPNGDLRTYLEGLAAADDMKTYVEQHPFGQGAVDETNPHWVYYSQVARSVERKMGIQ